MSETFRAPSQPCPSCGRQIDAHTIVSEEIAPPQKGDLTVCFRCAALLEFDAELRVHLIPDLAARTDICDDAKFELRRTQQKIQQYWGQQQ